MSKKIHNPDPPPISRKPPPPPSPPVRGGVPPRTMPSGKSCEQLARDMMERMGWVDAQCLSAGEVVELANLISDMRAVKVALTRCHDAFRRREHGGAAEQKLRHEIENIFGRRY